MMKKSGIIKISAAILILLLLGLLSFTSMRTKHATTAIVQPEGTVVQDIRMTDDGFEPAKITIKDGQAVRFINASHDKQHWPASNIHPTHDLYPEFDVKRGMAPAEQWVFTFRRKGTWPMHDHLYPYVKGTVTVE